MGIFNSLAQSRFLHISQKIPLAISFVSIFADESILFSNADGKNEFAFIKSSVTAFSIMFALISLKITLPNVVVNLNI